MADLNRSFYDDTGDRFDPAEPVPVKILASRIHRHRSYVDCMIYAGFQMPFREASYNEAIKFLEDYYNKNGRAFVAARYKDRRNNKKS